VQTPKKTAPITEALRAKAELSIEPQRGAAVDQRAIDEGRKPLTARRKDTAAIGSKVAELYGIPAEGLATIPPIESRFKFSPLDSDSEFNPLHLEQLLDQAASLLDRCMEERSRRDALQIEKWRLQLDLDRFFRLDNIQQRERQAGLDTLPYERAVMDGGAERSLEEYHKKAEVQRKTLMDDLLASGFNKLMAARELSAWLASYPLKDSELSGDDATYVYDGARKTKPDHLFEAARLETDQRAWEQVFTLLAERYGSVAAFEAARLRKESLTLTANFALADVGFRAERAQTERDVVWEQAYQAQSPGGLLNHNERIAAVERRFFADFREALARLIAVRRGFRGLYDYAPPFPEEGSVDYFDETVAWVRNAKNRLAQISLQDQNYVLALSLKDLAKSQWEAGLTSSQWTFDIPEAIFKDQAHVRIRGLSMTVTAQKVEEPEAPGQKAKAAQKADAPKLEVQKPEGYWSARVWAPPSATVRYASGTTHELDQKSLPPCFLGRVTDRESAQQPEVTGTVAWSNTSPIGKQWRVALSPRSTSGTTTDKLQDVQLYLHVTVQGMKMGA
jgi:hypothetical protein